MCIPMMCILDFHATQHSRFSRELEFQVHFMQVMNEINVIFLWSSSHEEWCWVYNVGHSRWSSWVIAWEEEAFHLQWKHTHKRFPKHFFWHPICLLMGKPSSAPFHPQYHHCLHFSALHESIFFLNPSSSSCKSSLDFDPGRSWSTCVVSLRL